MGEGTVDEWIERCLSGMVGHLKAAGTGAEGGVEKGYGIAATSLADAYLPPSFLELGYRDTGKRWEGLIERSEREMVAWEALKICVRRYREAGPVQSIPPRLLDWALDVVGGKLPPARRGPDPGRHDHLDWIISATVKKISGLPGGPTESRACSLVAERLREVPTSVRTRSLSAGNVRAIWNTYGMQE